MKDFWKKVEDFLTNIPAVVLWILLVIGLFCPDYIGVPLAIIVIILFCYKNKN